MNIPNKHLPECPTGPAPSEKPDTPPASPPTKHADAPPKSLLYPPLKYEVYSRERDWTIYGLFAEQVAAALDHQASQPLPEPSQIFPWLHGLHPQNQIQQAFFVARRRALRKTPLCFRGITVVKADGDLTRSRLKGAIAPDELLEFGRDRTTFKEIDPREGFSVRNFQIQAAKCAMLSDIIVYGSDERQTRRVARGVASAQKTWREEQRRLGNDVPNYHTFVCLDRFEEFEARHPNIVFSNSKGQHTGAIMDFFQQERVEMATMTRASEIATNVWLGPTPDPILDPKVPHSDENWDLFVECSDLGRLDSKALVDVCHLFDQDVETRSFIDFPSSGSIMPPTWQASDAGGIVEACRILYNLANGIRPLTAPAPATREVGALDNEGDSPMPDSQTDTATSTARPRKILIHCADGYTESSMLAIAYYIFAHGCSVGDAWLQLHVQKQRNFFAYPSDVALLTAIAPQLLSNSPVLVNRPGEVGKELEVREPAWLGAMDGSLPSRITPYMYLGNLAHANNPELLRALGIGQVLSVGEPTTWSEEERERWGEENVCVVKGVQDNGVDPLTSEFGRCLGFIGRLLPFSSFMPVSRY
jgi:dual specificity MAP kinase phosphatase